MLIGILISNVVETKTHNSPTEGGFYKLEVRASKKKLEKSGDPRGFVMREIGVNLAQAVLDTGIPKEYWAIRFTAKVQNAFNLPSGLHFNLR